MPISASSAIASPTTSLSASIVQVTSALPLPVVFTLESGILAVSFGVYRKSCNFAAKSKTSAMTDTIRKVLRNVIGGGCPKT